MFTVTNLQSFNLNAGYNASINSSFNDSFNVISYTIFNEKGILVLLKNLLKVLLKYLSLYLI